MKISINKNIIENILGYDIIDFKIKNNKIVIIKSLNDDKHIKIDIYEFAHRCKKWSTSLRGKKYQIYSGETSNGGTAEIYSGAIKQIEEVEADTELEAIFIACDWIINKINQ